MAESEPKKHNICLYEAESPAETGHHKDRRDGHRPRKEQGALGELQEPYQEH